MVHPIHSMFGSRLYGFRGLRIEWRYFRFDKIQDGGQAAILDSVIYMLLI